MTVPLEIAQKYYTVAEFMTLKLDPGKRYELVRGELKEMSHPGGKHMLITARLSKAILKWILSYPGPEPGEVLPPGGFKLAIKGADKDTVRAPDLAYITANKVASLGDGAIEFPPDLAIEVYSPNDRPGELGDKLKDYQAAGWDLIWVIYPDAAPKNKRNTVEVYRLSQSVTPIKTLQTTDQLDGEEILPGLSLVVGDLF